MTIVETLANGLERRTGRRGFLRRLTLWSTAMATATTTFTMRPTSAYAAICGCSNQNCDCSSKCCGGYTEFCCTIYGENACPPGGVLGGWWKVDGSEFCGGQARYYMDCHNPCGGCGCGNSGICSGTCNGTECSCGNHDCNNRKAGCVHFRYGNCNNHVTCIGPIICRVVTCTKPWEVDAGCSTAVRIDNGTRYHDSPCLHTSHDPIGFVDSASGLPGEIRLRGWALDLDNTSISPWLHVYVDGTFATAIKPNDPRGDVQNVYGTETRYLGFDDVISATPGLRRVCVYAINIEGGRNRLISCVNVSVPSESPQGNLELVEATGSGIRVKGWVFDRSDLSASVTIQVTANSELLMQFPASVSRNDVANFFDLPGVAYGFDREVAARDGSIEYCVTALDLGGDGNSVTLGCRTIQLDRDPTGWLDSATFSANTLKVRGWAIDPDTSDSINVHIYADGQFVGAGRADRQRLDVANTFGVGETHGFDFEIAVTDQPDTVKAYGINIGPGRNTLIGTKNP